MEKFHMRFNIGYIITFVLLTSTSCRSSSILSLPLMVYKNEINKLEMGITSGQMYEKSKIESVNEFTMNVNDKSYNVNVKNLVIMKFFEYQKIFSLIY